MAITNSIRQLLINWDGDNLLQNLRIRGGAGIRGGTVSRTLEHGGHTLVVNPASPISSGKWRVKGIPERDSGTRFSHLGVVGVTYRPQSMGEMYVRILLQDLLRPGGLGNSSGAWGVADQALEMTGDFQSDLRFHRMECVIMLEGQKADVDFEVWGR